jgi:hypothetical protein
MDNLALEMPMNPLRRSAAPGIDELSAFPHDCPRCGSPAYVGFKVVECTNPHCPHAGSAAKERQKRPRTSSFICWSGARGGPPCSGIVVLTDGKGTCPTCGNSYAASPASRP